MVVGHYLLGVFLPKTDHFWSSKTFSKKQEVKEKFSGSFGQNS